MKSWATKQLTWTTFHMEPHRSRVYYTRFFETWVTETQFLNEQNLIISNTLSKTQTLSLKRAKSLSLSHSNTPILHTQNSNPKPSLYWKQAALIGSKKPSLIDDLPLKHSPPLDTQTLKCQTLTQTQTLTLPEMSSFHQWPENPHSVSHSRQ